MNRGFKFKSEYIFETINIIFLGILAASCLIPFMNVLAVSLSDSASAAAGKVGLLPVNFNLDSYIFAFKKTGFIISMKNSVIRLLVGTTVNMVLTILTAYPLSKTKRELRGRTFLSWFFVITMLVGGGLIPTYLIVTWTGLRNSIWALVLPGAVPVYNVVILLNFFRQVPKEFEESAFIDGAGNWRILLQIFLPLSIPSIATLIVFQTVAHWNEWFSGMIYMDNLDKYPLATYLHNVLVLPSFDNLDLTQIQRIMKVNNRTLNSAQILIGALPIIVVYPFLQRFFVKGLTLGGLKG